MALNVGDVYATLGLDTSGWTGGLQVAEKSMTSTMSSVVATATAAAVTIGGLFTAAAAFGVNVAAGMETTQVAFETLLGSAEAAGEYVTKLRDDAAATPFEFAGLAKSAQRLVGMGMTAEQARLSTLALGDAVAAVGGDSAALDRASTAFGQIAAKGKVSLEEVLQLAENNIPALQYLAEGMGVSVAEAMDKISAGQVSAAVGLNALIEGIAKNSDGAMERQSATLTGRLSTLKDDVSNALGGAFAPLRDTISQMLGPVTELAVAVVDAMQPLIDGAGLAAKYVGALAAAFNTLSPDAKSAAIQIAVVGGALLMASQAMGGFSGMAAAATAPVAAAGSGLMDFASVIGNFGQAAQGAVAVVGALAPRIAAWGVAQAGATAAAAAGAVTTAGMTAATTAEAVAATGAAASTGLFAGVMAALEVVLTPVILLLAGVVATMTLVGVGMLGAATAVTAAAVAMYAAWSTNFLGIQEVTYEVVDALAVAFDGLSITVGKAFDSIKSMIIDAMSGALLAVQDVLWELSPLIDGLGAGGILTVAFESIDAANRVLESPDMGAALKTEAAGALDAVGAALTGLLPPDAQQAFTDFLNGVQTAGGGLDDYSGALADLVDTLSGGGGKAGKAAATNGSVSTEGYYDPAAEALQTAAEKLAFYADPLDVWLNGIAMEAGSVIAQMDALDGALEPTIAELEALYQAAADLVQFWSDMAKTALSKTGDIGGIISAAVEGFKSAGVEGAIAGGTLAALDSSEAFAGMIETLNATVSELVTVLDPVINAVLMVLLPALNIVAVVLSALAPLLEQLGYAVSLVAPIIMVLTPLIAAMASSFSMLTTMIEMVMPAIETAFKVLFEVLSYIGQGLLYVMLGVQTLWNKIIGTISNIIAKIADTLNSDALKSVSDKLNDMKFDTDATSASLAELQDMTWDSAYAEAVAAASATDMAEATDAATEALTNVPSGYKVAMSRFEAMAAEVDAVITSISGTAAAAGGTTGGSRGAMEENTAGKVTGGVAGSHSRSGRSGGNTYVNVGRMALSVKSVTDLAMSADKEAGRRRRALTGLPITTAPRYVGEGS